jgi:hypothetical protein
MLPRRSPARTLQPISPWTCAFSTASVFALRLGEPGTLADGLKPFTAAFAVGESMPMVAFANGSYSAPPSSGG